jgi:hypothetical protein
METIEEPNQDIVEEIQEIPTTYAMELEALTEEEELTENLTERC